MVVTVGDRYGTKAKNDRAYCIETIAEAYQNATKSTLITDTINTRKPGLRHEVFHPDKAKAIWDRFQFEYRPKHGSRLNMAEMELRRLYPTTGI